eukprot:CAMPEP_0197257672 /NCGR_PEP_ID=MMETSP1429-20130617/79545_1 /TAXON_ID=49237 /ORGANISM="Chaetoceros  sp., Strain UNC1202" /LENGTH=209 /DNA_ID=CAMNT_0042721581 /DNA_START=1 /DNA_END=630 /DNA_ORIENTATION=+
MLPQHKSNVENEADKKEQNRQKSSAKFIYLIRSPLDTCVSFYHHLSHQVEGCYEKSIDDFFREWMDGEIPFGSWTDHLLSYAPLIAADKVFLLSYEDMVNDLKGSVIKLVKYLEMDDVLTTGDIDEIVPSFSFQSMKKDLNRFQPKSVTWKNDFKFLRKGVVGDQKQQLSNASRNEFEKRIDANQFIAKVSIAMQGKGKDSIQMLMRST